MAKEDSRSIWQKGKHMKLQDFAQLTGQELEALDTDTLRSLVSAQAGTLNRRLINIKYNPDTSKIALKAVQESGGKFTTRSHYNTTANGARKPMTRKELLYEAKREISFAKSKGSTVSSAKKLKDQMQRIGGGQTSKEYAKKKAKEARAKVRAQIYAENRAAGRRANKYTKAQKYAMKKAGEMEYKKAIKQYDDAMNNAWESYHLHKEMNQMESRAEFNEGPTIQETVQKAAFMSKEDRENYFRERFEKMVEDRGENEEVMEEVNPLDLVDAGDDIDDGWTGNIFK